MRPHKLRSWAGVAQDNIAVMDDHLCVTFLYSRAASGGMEGIVALRWVGVLDMQLGPLEIRWLGH